MPRIPSSLDREEDLEQYLVHTCAPCHEENLVETASAKCQVRVIPANGVVDPDPN